MVPQPYTTISGQVLEQRLPIATTEALITAVGRELWLAADELISASAGIASYGGNNKLERAYSPVNLFRASLTLRLAADKIMEGYWETAQADLADAATAFSGFIHSSCFQGVVDAFSYYVPIPPSEFPETADSLLSIADALEMTLRGVISNGLLPFRKEACTAMSRAAESFRRAANLFNDEESFEPRDPRRNKCSSKANADDAFQTSLVSLQRDAMSMIAPDSSALAKINQICTQLRTMAKRPGCRAMRRSLLEEMTSVSTCSMEITSEDWSQDQFFLFVFLHRIRGYDFGVVFPHLERVKEQLQSVKVIPGTENARYDMLLEFEREYRPSRTQSRGGDCQVVYNYVQRLLLAEEQNASAS